MSTQQNNSDTVDNSDAALAEEELDQVVGGASGVPGLSGGGVPGLAAGGVAGKPMPRRLLSVELENVFISS